MVEQQDPRVDPWLIDEGEFYELESETEQMRFLLSYAVLAPSGHNTQPWSFHITRDGIEVYADYSRRLEVADPLDRELMISIGAAIANLRVAAAHFGFESTVLYQARSERRLPVALVALRETSVPPANIARLFRAITARHTNREEYDQRSIGDTALTQLCDFMESHGTFVQFVVPHDRVRASELVARGDRILIKSKAFRSELADWIRSTDTPAADGMCADGLGVPSPLARATPWFLRRFDMGTVQAKHDADLVEHAAGLIVLTSEDDHVSLIRAGETLEELLLLLTQLGLNYSFLNAPVEVETLRSELWSMIRSPHPPQLLLRIGYARKHVKAQPRREVEQVLV